MPCMSLGTATVACKVVMMQERHVMRSVNIGNGDVAGIATGLAKTVMLLAQQTTTLSCI
jgi:hypothetical protein